MGVTQWTRESNRVKDNQAGQVVSAAGLAEAANCSDQQERFKEEMSMLKSGACESIHKLDPVFHGGLWREVIWPES